MGNIWSKSKTPTGMEAQVQMTSGPSDQNQPNGAADIDSPVRVECPAKSSTPAASLKFDSQPRHESQATELPDEHQSVDSGKGLEPATVPLSPTNSNTAVDPEEDPTQSPYGGSLPSAPRTSEKRRHSGSTSFAVQDTEICHPETEMPVFRRRSTSGRPSLRIVDPILLDVLRGSPIGLSSNSSLEGVFLSPAASIHEPYEMLFYNRNRILNVIQNHDGQNEVGKHAQFLLDFMQNERRATWRKADELDRNQCESIAFEDSWLLYPPGETVFRRDAGGWRAYKVARVEVSAYPSLDPIRIYGYYLGFDKSGTVLVPQLEILTVNPYPSEQPMSRLEVVPRWHIEQTMGNLCSDLVQRGKLYWNYRDKPFHQSYAGDAWPTASGNTFNVVIDHVTASGHGRDHQYLSRPLQCLACLGKALQLGPYPEQRSPHDPDVCRESSPAKATADAFPSLRSKVKMWEDAMDTADESLLLYCPSMVWAFSLQHKSWQMVQITHHLHDIEPQEAAWKHRLIHNEEQSHLDSMVSSFFDDRDPILIGKRRGLNVLLHGGPGTGKTFTAECLAEKYAAPIYRFTAATLGMDPINLDRELSIAVRRAADWGAILVIEDADAFLQDRNMTGSIHHGMLVSVFTSQLDLSDALVFITTCSDEKLDKALLSRIHMGLYLKDLDFAEQSIIWCNLIDSVNLVEADKKLLKDFVDVKLKSMPKDDFTRNMNGHQIQSCFQAALALATRERQGDREVVSLKVHQLQKVLGLGEKFRRFMKGTPEVGVDAIFGQLKVQASRGF